MHPMLESFDKLNAIRVRVERDLRARVASEILTKMQRQALRGAPDLPEAVLEVMAAELARRGTVEVVDITATGDDHRVELLWKPGSAREGA